MSKKTFKTNVANVAAEQNFYDIGPEVGEDCDPQVVETVMAIHEAHYAQALGELLEEVEQTDKFTPGPSHRNRTIADFLMEHRRTRNFRNWISAAMEGVTSLVVDQQNLAVKLVAGRGETVTSAQWPKPGPIEMSPLAHAKFIFGGKFISKIFPIIFDHIWLIGDNQTSQPLYTSCVPVVKRGHFIHPRYGGGGFGSRGVEIQLPLSSRFVLIIW